MDITTVKAFFMWCTIINVGMMGLSRLGCAFLSDLSYRMNTTMFSISRETFSIETFKVAFLSYIALFEIIVIVFNIVPYIALVIIV